MIDEQGSWRRARALFERLCDAPAAEQQAQLASLERSDAAAAAEVRALLAADGASCTALDRGAGELHLDCLRREADESLLETQLDGYRLEAVLGEGGTATVFLGVRSDGARAAIKVLKAGLVSPDLAARFCREREVLGSLHHPGLIAVLGAGETPDGRPYLITEHIEGLPIDAWCRERGLDTRARLSLFVQVCHAVHHAHRHLVVHRDLKPSNILVDCAGQPRVLDFGIAKLLEPHRDPGWTTLASRAPMTPSFASPEQVRGEPVTTASDIYSLGVLLYHLLLGQSPYRPPPGERGALELAVLQDAPRSPREFGAAPLPRDLATLLAVAMRKEPGERYPSAEHLADDIGRYLERRPLRARRQPPLLALLGAVRRHPIATSAITGACCLVLGGWIVTASDLARVRASESIAWRAHANAVTSTNLLADLLVQIGATGTREQLAEPLRAAEAHVQQLGEPEAEARLRLALARVQMRLGLAAPARDHLERALALARSTRGLSWRDADQCLELLVELAIERSDAAAITLATERLDTRRANGTDPLPAEQQLARARALRRN
ncbi:MAG TPA: serine/threonine-protein kinase [Planctomycetota bacterium]|nr:serine/threonine-protein kinase [Planctomycetota bacterium]